MFCTNCGTQSVTGSQFCRNCGAPSSIHGQAPPPNQPWTPSPNQLWGGQTPAAVYPQGTSSAGASNGFSIAGIVCGAVAFLFFPIILGPAGLVLGAVGMSKKESLGWVALVVSGAGLVIGMLLGIIVAANSLYIY